MTDQHTYWQGRVDERLDDHERRLAALNGHIRDGANAINVMGMELAKLKTRVAMYAVIGSAIGGAVSTVIAALTVAWILG